MGNCACPINKCAKKEDVLVGVGPDFSNVFNIIQHGEGQMFCLLENTWKNGEWYEGRRVKWKD